MLFLFSRVFLSFALLVIFSSVNSGAEENGALVLRVQEAGQSTALPCRVHLKNLNGKPLKTPELLFWNDHFVCDGEVQVDLPPGAYQYEIERGPEYSVARGIVEVRLDAPAKLALEIQRIANLASEGWWSGETHVHRETRHAELLMRAEDLHVAHFITWWNETNPWAGDKPGPSKEATRFDQTYFYYGFSGEDEREGGALLYHNLARPLDVTGAKDHYPSSITYAREARKQSPDAWIEAEKPYWWDLPLWIAEGVVDAVGIANNHMQRLGLLNNEMRGRPRDLKEFPTAAGNGLWTQEIYYHLLNCGLRIPPSAGSASGVLANPVGYNRIYAHVDGELTYEKWTAAVRSGRTFVTNGPLLRCTVDGQIPGHVFRSTQGGTAPLKFQLSGRDKVSSIELIQNGKLVRTLSPEVEDAGVVDLIPGWFLIRCIADVSETFRFASTAPFYVEAANHQPHVSKNSIQFFLDWCDDRVKKLDAVPEFSSEQRAETLLLWKKTKHYWEEKLAQASAN